MKDGNVDGKFRTFVSEISGVPFNDEYVLFSLFAGKLFDNF